MGLVPEGLVYCGPGAPRAWCTVGLVPRGPGVPWAWCTMGLVP